MAKMIKMTEIPRDSNPFLHDFYHMGTGIGNNIVIMYDCADDEQCDYLILVNKNTGERQRIVFLGKETPSLAEAICNKQKK